VSFGDKKLGTHKRVRLVCTSWFSGSIAYCVVWQR
jgi:hypothetical protein